MVERIMTGKANASYPGTPSEVKGLGGLFGLAQQAG